MGPGDLDGRWVVSRVLSEAENKQGRFQGSHFIRASGFRGLWGY